jgi:hypothetical protein
MNVINRLPKLARLVLANLEEAGEDDLAALLNTVTGRRGSAEEVSTFSAALTDLIQKNLLAIATRRDDVSRQWIPLNNLESLDVVARLNLLLRWYPKDLLWNISQNTFRPHAVLTDAGICAARMVLEEDGWPNGTRSD